MKYQQTAIRLKGQGNRAWARPYGKNIPGVEVY